MGSVKQDWIYKTPRLVPKHKILRNVSREKLIRLIWFI